MHLQTHPDAFDGTLGTLTLCISLTTWENPATSDFNLTLPMGSV